MAISQTLAALTQTVVLAEEIRSRVFCDNFGLSVMATGRRVDREEDSRPLSTPEQPGDFLIVCVDGVRQRDEAMMQVEGRRPPQAALTSLSSSG